MQSLLISAAGISLLLLIAFALSSDRKNIRLRVVGAAFAMQAGIALLVLYVHQDNRRAIGLYERCDFRLGQPALSVASVEKRLYPFGQFRLPPRPFFASQ